jgi:hypothetical protein
MVRFETTGELFMLPMLVRHGARQTHTVCCQPRRAERMAEATGEHWTPTAAVGQACTRLAANHARRFWLKCTTAEPEH